MTRKTVTVFSATGTVGVACVEELIRQDLFNVSVLARKSGQQEKSTTGLLTDASAKQRQYAAWQAKGVEVKWVDAAYHAELIPALEGTDYLVSCVPYNAAESQYPLIWAAKEAGVERFVPSEFGAIYEFEQFWQTPNSHRAMARQKAFIRRVIELAGLDFTIVAAGLWPEYYMLEPVAVMGDGDAPVAWSSGPDVGRIIPHLLAHPASRNAICPVAATAFCSWNDMLAAMEKTMGRKVERFYPDAKYWKTAYDRSEPGSVIHILLAIGIAVTDTPAGMSLFGHWNKTFIPEFKGTPLDQVVRERIEPFVSAMTAAGAAYPRP